MTNECSNILIQQVIENRRHVAKIVHEPQNE